MTTLTKKMAEDLTNYLLGAASRSIYAPRRRHHRRVEIIRDLREGNIDVLVGINLLREGRPARGIAGGHPRRRQGGVSPLVELPDPDHRPRGPQCIGHGHHVRRRDYRRDAQGHRRDRPSPWCRRTSPTTRSTASTRSRSSRRSSDVNDMLAKEDVDTATLLEGGYRNAGKAGNTHLGCPPSLDAAEADKRHEEILKAGLPAGSRRPYPSAERADAPPPNSSSSSSQHACAERDPRPQEGTAPDDGSEQVSIS